MSNWKGWPINYWEAQILKKQRLHASSDASSACDLFNTEFQGYSQVHLDNGILVEGSFSYNGMQSDVSNFRALNLKRRKFYK